MSDQGHSITRKTEAVSGRVRSGFHPLILYFREDWRKFVDPSKSHQHRAGGTLSSQQVSYAPTQPFRTILIDAVRVGIAHTQLQTANQLFEHYQLIGLCEKAKGFPIRTI